MTKPSKKSTQIFRIIILTEILKNSALFIDTNLVYFCFFDNYFSINRPFKLISSYIQDSALFSKTFLLIDLVIFICFTCPFFFCDDAGDRFGSIGSRVTTGSSHLSIDG